MTMGTAGDETLSNQGNSAGLKKSLSYDLVGALAFEKYMYISTAA
jgi:hypothetical protein